MLASRPERMMNHIRDPRGIPSDSDKRERALNAGRSLAEGLKAPYTAPKLGIRRVLGPPLHRQFLATAFATLATAHVE